jgi:hypothetical protein
MANDRVVWDVAVTLQELFRSEVALPDGGEVRVVADVPGAPPAGERPLMYVCLYEVEENAPARRMEKTLVASLEQDGDLHEYYRFPSLPVTLRFVVTCVGRTTEEEHRILGQVLRIIHDHPVLQGEAVKGDSVAPDEKVHLAVRSPVGIEMQSRFWQAVGQRFRPSVACQVSVNVDSERRDRVVRVKERVVDVKRSVTGS